MIRSERKLFWPLAVIAAALVFGGELFLMPMSVLKVIVCVAALVVMSIAAVASSQRRRRK
jgi:hypothetical protein